MKENIETPNIKMKHAIHLSEILQGEKSPNPIVLKVVNAKYHILTSLSIPSNDSPTGVKNTDLKLASVGFNSVFKRSVTIMCQIIPKK